MGGLSNKDDRICIDRTHPEEPDDRRRARGETIHVEGRARTNRAVQRVFRYQTPRTGYVARAWTGRLLIGRRSRDYARRFSMAARARKITGAVNAIWRATTRP